MKQVALSELADQPVSHNPAILKKVMLACGDLPVLTNFSQARFGPGQVSPGHIHTDMAEVFFTENGRGEIEVDGVIVVLTPGRCVAVSAGEWHEIRAGEEGLVLTYFGLQV
ncbi:MAG: cupin domain-containing protein [Anaerolineae bacterium]|nr:MAG: cupin domain-containing protein [Anaerolineae bacterium]